MKQAKEKQILFPDQIFLPESAHLYPMEIDTEYTFKGGLKVRFRAIKPSDDDAGYVPILTIICTLHLQT